MAGKGGAIIKRYTTLFFDADDTLLDFQQAEALALQKMFARYRIPFDKEMDEQYQQINRGLWRAFEQGQISRDQVTDTRFQTLFGQLGISLDGKAFNQEYLKALGEESCLLEGAYELCRDLSRTHSLYCMTNGVAGTQRSRLKGSGLERFFKDIFVSEELGFQKPMKEYFLAAFQHIGEVSVENSLMIGDSLTSDIQGGCNIGMDTCWYNPKGKENPGAVSPTYEINSFQQLRQLLGE